MIPSLQKKWKLKPISLKRHDSWDIWFNIDRTNWVLQGIIIIYLYYVRYKTFKLSLTYVCKFTKIEMGTNKQSTQITFQHKLNNGNKQTCADPTIRYHNSENIVFAM